MTGYFFDIWRLRYFWMSLVRADLRRRYRGSILGIGWSLLQPIAMTVVLCVVFSRIFKEEIWDFAPYLLSGLTFWSFFTAAVMQGCQSIFHGESYIRQQPTPLAIYPLRAVLGAGFHFLLGLGLTLVLVWGVKGFSNVPALLSLVPALLLLFVIGWSLAACMGVVNVLFQDAQHLIEVALQVLFYVTPIMYKPEMLGSGRLARLINLNPIAMLLELIRNPLLEGQPPSLHALSVALLFGLATVVASGIILVRLEKRIIFYL